MTDLLRRRMLQLGSTTFISNVLLSSPVNAQPLQDQNLVDDLLQLQRIWLQKTELHPIQYLSKHQNLMKLGDDKRKQIIAEDFLQGETIEINGLILSKTEAALAALSVEVHLAELV